MADLAVWQRTIVDEEGNAIPGAEVAVRRVDTGALVSIYLDRDGTTTAPNPIKADSSGFVRFFVQGGAYQVEAYGAGSALTWNFVAVGRLAEFDVVDADQVTDSEAGLAAIRAKLRVSTDEELQDAVSDAEAAADRAEAARDAAQLNAGIFPNIAAGLSATTDGDYFSVPSDDSDEYLILYRNDSGSATEVQRYPSAEAIRQLDSLSVNRGKPFPLKPIVRDGVLSPAGTTNYNDFLLDAQVIGPPESIDGYYFRIGYFQNDALASGKVQKGVAIQRLPIDTYETSSEYELIHGYSDTPIDYTHGTGVQTVTIHPDRTDEPIEIRLTIDTDKLPPPGTYINSTDASNSSGSWIIDTSRYHRVRVPSVESLPFDSLTVNKGKHYPLRPANVGGDVSDEHPTFTALLLDIEVIGAEPGKVYHCNYYQNGAVLGGSPGYGWVFRERLAEGMEDDTELGERVIVTGDHPEEIIDRDGGVQTIWLESPRRPGLVFKVTLDASELPADGTAINSNNRGSRGFTWIIDPSRYSYPRASSGGSAEGLLGWQIFEGDLLVSYPSNGKWYRITFGPNGFNNLPNFKRVEISEDGASWTTLQSTSTDWLPPIVIAAVNNGDDGDFIYTGGNHGSDGGSGGEQTARNIHFAIAPDGAVATEGSGAAREVAVTVVNEVMAYNTISFPRYVLRETFKLLFYAGGVSVTCTRTPYEDLVRGNDNGLQATTQNIVNVGTYLIYGGENDRSAMDGNAATAGPAEDYPDAWATVMHAPLGGQFVIWMDREFGVGRGEILPDTYVRVSANNKIYNRVGWPGETTTIGAGESYSWRGGYCWSWPEAISGLDSTFLYRKGGDTLTAYAVDNEDWWTL